MPSKPIRMLSCVLTSLCAASALLVIVVAPCLAAPVPEGISRLYDDLRIAGEMEDMDAILGRFSPVMKLQASLGSPWLLDLATIFREREGLAVEMALDECKVVGDRALVLSTWAFSGKTTATGEAWSTTLHQVDILHHRAGNWEIVSLAVVDPEATQRKVVEGTYQDPNTGLEATAPPKWPMFALQGFRAAALAISPDLSTDMMWIVQDVPGTFTAEQVLRAADDAVEKLGAQMGLTFKDVTAGQWTLAGRPSYRTQRVYVVPGAPEYFAQMNAVMAGTTVYMVEVAAYPAPAFAEHQGQTEQAQASTKISEPQAAALPPEAGRAEGRKYVNETYGCEITAPEGWETKVEQGQFKLQVSMREPNGASNVTLGMVELPDVAITAQQAIEGDERVSAAAFEQYQLVRQGETKVGDLPAYESVTQFSLGGQPRVRWRIYLVDGNRLFFLFADAAPADKWEKLEKVLGEAMQSFKVTEGGNR